MRYSDKAFYKVLDMDVDMYIYIYRIIYIENYIDILYRYLI